MPTIEPDLDRYGSHVRPSCLADLVELASLADASPGREELADYIRDCNWTRFIMANPFTSSRVALDEELEAGGLGEQVEESLEAADVVFEVLRTRLDAFGDRYPFDLSGAGLEKKHDWREDPGQQAYALLLLVTTIHAHDAQCEVNPREYFEDLVEAALRDRGLRTGALARARRRGEGFDAALAGLGEECGLRPEPVGAVRRVRAHDEGVDIVAHLDWDDPRPIQWVFLAQATCAMSDNWRAKIAEPSPHQWKGLLGLRVYPRGLLAVPHHIPDNMLSWITEKHPSAYVLDRVRLVLALTALPEGAEEILKLAEQLTVEFS